MPTFKKGEHCISLIGMPGAGKSTVGVILAKLAGMRFIDTDLEIQSREQATLQQLLELHGYRHLRAIEQRVISELDPTGAVISTGGSAVYAEIAMRHLLDAGPVVYLQVDLETLERRIADAPLRGIAADPRQKFSAVMAERTPLYQHYANFTVDTAGANPDRIATEILRKLQLPM